MIVYHIGENLEVGTELICDYKKNDLLIFPFITSLETSLESFKQLYNTSMYIRAVMRRSKLREWSNCAKWATEGIFEFIRRNEFSNAESRIHTNYYYDNIELCKRLYKIDYVDSGDDPDENMNIFEIELNELELKKYDMSIYDDAYEFMENSEIEKAIDCARKYYSGEFKKSIMEILSSKRAVVKSKLGKPI